MRSTSVIISSLIAAGATGIQARPFFGNPADTSANGLSGTTNATHDTLAHGPLDSNHFSSDSHHKASANGDVCVDVVLNGVVTKDCKAHHGNKGGNSNGNGNGQNNDSTFHPRPYKGKINPHNDQPTSTPSASSHPHPSGAASPSPNRDSNGTGGIQGTSGFKGNGPLGSSGMCDESATMKSLQAQLDQATASNAQLKKDYDALKAASSGTVAQKDTQSLKDGLNKCQLDLTSAKHQLVDNEHQMAQYERHIVDLEKNKDQTHSVVVTPGHIASRSYSESHKEIQVKAHANAGANEHGHDELSHSSKTGKEVEHDLHREGKGVNSDIKNDSQAMGSGLNKAEHGVNKEVTPAGQSMEADLKKGDKSVHKDLNAAGDGLRGDGKTVDKDAHYDASVLDKGLHSMGGDVDDYATHEGKKVDYTLHTDGGQLDEDLHKSGSQALGGGLGKTLDVNHDKATADTILMSKLGQGVKQVLDNLGISTADILSRRDADDMLEQKFAPSRGFMAS